MRTQKSKRHFERYDEFLSFLSDRVRFVKIPNEPLLIGVNGIDDIGKSTLAEQLKQVLSEQA